MQQWSTLEEAWLQLIANSKAPGTWKNVLKHVAVYEEFTSVHNLVDWPMAKRNVCIFLTYLTLLGNSYLTVRNYFYSLNEWQQLLGHPPMTVSGILKATLQGIKRTVASQTRQARPLSINNLLLMSELVNYASQEQVAVWAAILTGFHLMLRKSNLVPDRVQGFDMWQHLTRADVENTGSGLLIHLKWSKTRQAGEEIWLPLVPNGTPCCPVKALLQVFANCPCLPHDPLFAYRRADSKKTTVTYHTLQRWLRTWGEEVGLDPREISSHSLRRGGATTAFIQDIDVECIRAMGDWASNCYQRYIQLGMSQRRKLAARMAVAFSRCSR